MGSGTKPTYLHDNWTTRFCNITEWIFTEVLKEFSLHCVKWELLLRIKKKIGDVDFEKFVGNEAFDVYFEEKA